MSTQLILYPQTYQGEYSSTASPSTIQYIVNGILFTGFNNTSLYNSTAPHPSQDAIDNQPPTILGNWYRFTTTGGDYGAVAAPTYGLGAVQLSHNAVVAGQTGIYQKLSNLVVGAVYDVKISVVTPQAELLTFEMYNGSVLYNQAPLSANTATITTTFTAQSSNDIFLIYYEGLAANLSISKISVLQSPTSPSLVYTDLQDGQVICDLYQEEDIPLSLSIDDFKNVAEQVKSYSKDFNLPATKRNNQIFNNMFEITRADDGLIFNPYVKTKCVLKEDGFILFEGYLRLIDVKDKEGEISYNVNLYSEVIALADILKDKTFAELDFSELDHKYNKSTIKSSWDNAIGLPLENSITDISFAYSAALGYNNTNVLKYPFIDWTHQYIISQNTGVSGPTFGNPELTALEQAFRPCIQLKYLINKIFAASGFNWTSNFFDSTDFENLFMDFNWGADNAPNTFNLSGELTKLSPDFSIPVTYTTLPFDEMTLVNGNTLSSEFGYSAGAFTAQENGQIFTVNFNIIFKQPPLSNDILDVQWLVNGVPVDQATSIAPNFTYAGNFTTGVGSIPTLSAGDTVLCQAKSTLGLWDLENVETLAIFNTPELITVTASVSQMTNQTFLETLRGELGQWDFLKGIMTMFNLVSMVDETNAENILIEPYADIFINNTRSNDLNDQSLSSRFDGKIHDWTDKIDASEMELKPLTDLNKDTIFKFVEDEDDYAFLVYKNSTTGHLYGSKEIDASGFTILEGEKEIIAEPFAATVSKPLDNYLPNFIVPSIYSMTDDGTSEGFENSPRIFYNNGEKSTGASYYIPEQNGFGSENQPNFLQFSHLSDIPTITSTPPSATDTRDFVFESSQLFTGLGNSPVNNLYNTYWSPYFNELYNADTRTMTLKVNLSPTDVASFKFYDTVFIKNRVFRVNKIDYKPNDLATVEFILIP